MSIRRAALYVPRFASGLVAIAGLAILTPIAWVTVAALKVATLE